MDTEGKDNTCTSLESEQEVTDKSYEDFWDSTLKKVLTAVQVTLCRMSPRELDIDPNNGVTETSFKLCISTAMTILCPDIHFESERELGKGRIDLLLCHQGGGKMDPSCLALELKYVRLASILHPITKYQEAQDFQAKLLKWEKLRKIIMQAETTSLLEVKIKFMASEDRTGENNSINDLIYEGTCQNLDYCRSVRVDPISRIGFKSKLLHCVVLGVGSRVLQTPVEIYRTGT